MTKRVLVINLLNKDFLLRDMYYPGATVKRVTKNYHKTNIIKVDALSNDDLINITSIYKYDESINKVVVIGHSDGTGISNN